MNKQKAMRFTFSSFQLFVLILQCIIIGVASTLDALNGYPLTKITLIMIFMFSTIINVFMSYANSKDQTY